MNQARLEARLATVRCKPQSPKPLSSIQRYGLAVLSVSVALGGALVLERFHFRDVEVPLFLFAAAVAAWYGGTEGAVLALLLSCVSFDYFFVEPLYSIEISLSDLPYFIVFASFASLVTWFSALRRRVEGELRQARDDLEIEVAERTQQASLLRRSEAYLAEAQKVSRTGSFGWDVSTGKMYWSQETFRIFEYDPPTEPTLELVMHRTQPEDRALIQQVIDRVSHERKDFDFEHRLLMPNGSVKYLRVVGRPSKDESGSFEFVGAVMDITDLKRAEEMRAAMARERELFAQQRATELAKANEALRGCLDALASVPELDDFLG